MNENFQPTKMFYIGCWILELNASLYTSGSQTIFQGDPYFVTFISRNPNFKLGSAL